MSQLLTIRKVAERISFSKSWIYAQMKAGRFPRPLNLNFGKNLWSSQAIDSWLEEQIKRAESTTAEPSKKSARLLEARA